MNPSSGFGSGFGQPQLPSPFGTAAGSASGTPTAFGTSAPFTSSGSTSQAFGSGNTANTGFGTVGGATGFGLTSGTDSRSTVFGNPGLDSSSGNVFGSSGPPASGFGSGTPAPSFGTSTSMPGFGTGTMNQNAFGSGGTGVPGFGAPAFGSGTISAPNSNPGTGTQFGSGFNKGISFSALSSASSVTGGTSAGPVFGTGGSGFGGGTTAFGTSSSTVAPSGFAANTSSAFGTGTSGFGTGTSGFGTSTPGFGPVSTSTGTGASAFGTTTASGFGGGSSGFGSFTAAQSTSAPLSSTQSSSAFGGSSVFGARTGNTGQGFTSGSAVTLGTQAGLSVFGSRVSSSTPGLGGVPPTSVFGQIPASTAVVGSVTRSSGFGTNTEASSTGTSAAFGTVDRAAPFGVSTNTTGSVFGAQTVSAFGAPQQAAKDDSQKTSSTAGSLSSGVLPPPSYSASISSGQPGGVFGSSSTASVFGGASRTTSGEGGVFGGASRTTSGEGGVFGGASRTASGEGGVFGGATRTASGEGGVFGGATRTSSGEGGVFGGATRTASGEGGVFGGATRTASGEGGVFGGVSRTTSGQGSVFGGAGRSVIKQELSQQPNPPQMPPTAGVNQPPPSVFGGSSHTFGTFPDKKETNLTAETTLPSSSASVFGGRTNFTSSFGGPRAQQGTDGKAEATSSVFGGRQSNEKKESLPRQPLFPAAASSSVASSDQKIKHESGLSSRRPDAESTTAVSIFVRKREAAPVRSTFGFPTESGSVQSQKRSAAGDEEGGTDFKRGRTDSETHEDEEEQTTDHLQGTPERAKLRRSSSILEDISSKTICLKGIPAKHNKGPTLRRLFSRFGTVKRVQPAPSKRSAIITFENHEQASEAKKNGATLLGKDNPLAIFWRSSASDKSPVASPEETAQNRFPFRRPEAAEPRSGTGERGQSQRQLPSSLPSSVAAELASMSGADANIGGGAQRLRSAVEKRPAREGRSPQRSEPAAQRTRDKTPPPSSSSASTSSIASASGLGKTTNVTASGLRTMISTTTMEKVNVLDIRDKLMRQKIGKQSGGAIDSKAFVGTCPDMCPEKERLYREEMRRLSIYEIIPGSSTQTGSTSLVDQTRAVKEYSRSSADQDEPLPHELRPLRVLTMTMNYLLVEIADCGEDGKWSEWYDFLWNRTRSIRKEITQQQLCSQEVVDLLEKCVRFHIYCSERLCTEDMMVFDSKINDENLTKCLQTLKELYADMENKHGCYCPNEAEFRAYIVLMNLNEGDTLREVQQLRPEVRASPEIGFAVRAYSALYSNNYVRFFRLVQGAPFLNACVLHRYFNQIRARALQVILRSHTAGHKKVAFPLLGLQRLLVFEDAEEIKKFCSYYGLRTKGTDLLLDRGSYVEPESSIPSWRAVRLVESKRGAVSVGEVINGGPLQLVSLPPPQCSFDEHGRFMGSLEGLADSQESQDRVKPFEVRAAPKPVQLQPSPLVQTGGRAAITAASGDVNAASRQATVSTEDSAAADVGRQELKPSGEVLKTVARDLFFEVIGQHAWEVAESVMHAQQIARQWEEDIMKDVVSSVVSEVARQVGAEVVEVEKVRQNQLLAAEKREREAHVAGDVLMSVIQSAVEEQARDVAMEEIEEAEAMEEEERRERCTLAVQSEVLQKVTREMAIGVADEVHQTDVVARLQLLADLQKAVELRRTSQWLAIWRKALKVRERQKRAMLDFPCAPPMQSASQRLQSMYPSRPEHASCLVSSKAALLVNDRAQMTLLSPLECEHRSLTLTAHLSLASLLSSLQRTRAWQPLKLAGLLQAPLNQAVQRWPPRFVNELSPLSVQWKLLLSLPGEMEEEEEMEEDREEEDSRTGSYPHSRLMPVLKHWLCAKFTHGDSGAASTKKNVLSQYSMEVASNAVAPPRLRVGVCVRTVPEFGKRGKKEQPSKEQGLALTKGTSAILFLLPHADTVDETMWLAARLRLARLLEAKPFLPPTPLALLLPCGLDTTTPGSMTDEVTARLGVQEFKDQGLVLDVAVVELAVREGQPPDVAVAAPVLQTQVTEAVKFLAARVPEPPDLRRERLGDVVESMVNQHFFTPVLQDLKCRLNLNKLHQAPNTLIGLYNSVLDHIGLALTSPSLQDISWPAPELQLSAGFREDWNSTKHLGDVYELVSSLRLPWFHYKDPASMEWSQVCHDVWTFVNAVVKKRCDSAVSLTSRISRVLAHTCLQFENLCSLTQNEDHCTPTYVNAPWADVIVACAEFRLQRLHNWKEEEEDVGGDVEVLYEGEDLEEFEPPAAWIQALLDTEDTESQRVEDTVEQASILHFASQPAAEEPSLMDNTSAHRRHISGGDDNDRKNRSSSSTAASTAGRNEQAPPPPRHSDLPDNIRSALRTSEELLLHVGEERQKAQAFERYLEKALRGDTSPDLNLDLSTIFQSPSTPRVVSTPALSSATPARALSMVRRANSRVLSTPQDPSVRQANLRSSLEPRRLTGQGERAGRLAEAEVDRTEAERGREGSVPLCEGVERFKESLQAQRYANELFEKRLQSLLES